MIRVRPPYTELSPTTYSHFRPFSDPVTAVRLRRCFNLALIRSERETESPEEYYQRKAQKYWDNFYRRHKNKFFKDRHYLEKDWGDYFCDDSSCPDGKVVLEVGCGAGNSIFPLVAAYPNLYVHACDISSQAIQLVQTDVKFDEDRINAFICDVVNDDLSEKINPCSVDIITLIFTLSAVSPQKMPPMLRNLKAVLKPNGYVLLRDYSIGDFAQAKLQERNQMIGNGFYVRGDGTCSFYFSEDFLATLFLEAGFKAVDIEVYRKQIKNRSRNITMDRRWIRAVFGNS